MDHITKTNQTILPHLHHSTTSFPILAIALISILTLALLLISYYIFVIKCCLNIHRVDILSRFLSQTDTISNPNPNPGIDIPTRGLDSSTIQAIPVVPFKRRHERSFSKEECAVCLNEFIENEKLRAIPSCQHLFHVDCIDVWLQGNENCPLCRRSVSIAVSQMEYSEPKRDYSVENDEDYVVIELGNDPTPINSTRGRKLNHVSSMGDECIVPRGRDDRFDIQPIRRSFSMDSANDRQLYLSVREIIEKNDKNGDEIGLHSEVSSSSGRVRGLFSFGSGKGLSRSAVLPIEEP